MSRLNRSWLLALCLCLSGKLWAADILVMGDSISAGYGLPDNSGWVTLLSQRLQQQSLPYKITNISISGETTSGGLTRIAAALKQYQPQILILELGANDGLRGTPLKVIRANLTRLVQQAQAASAQVILVGMRIPPNYGRTYAEGFFQVFADVAKAQNTLYIPFFMQGIGGVPELMQNDGLHPNVKAQDILLENIWPVLLPQLTKN